jgi:hypothetical protein
MSGMRFAKGDEVIALDAIGGVFRGQECTVEDVAEETGSIKVEGFAYWFNQDRFEPAPDEGRPTPNLDKLMANPPKWAEPEDEDLREKQAILVWAEVSGLGVPDRSTGRFRVVIDPRSLSYRATVQVERNAIVLPARGQLPPWGRLLPQCQSLMYAEGEGFLVRCERDDHGPEVLHETKRPIEASWSDQGSAGTIDLLKVK